VDVSTFEGFRFPSATVGFTRTMRLATVLRKIEQAIKLKGASEGSESKGEAVVEGGGEEGAAEKVRRESTLSDALGRKRRPMEGVFAILTSRACEHLVCHSWSRSCRRSWRGSGAWWRSWRPSWRLVGARRAEGEGLLPGGHGTAELGGEGW
jgi:hypothetical protein